jgi:outer membrane protein assembly factor BamB
MPRRLLLPAAALLALSLAASPTVAAPFPAEIQLPDGYQPEGITDGTGTTAYVGSLADGAIVRVNVRTGSVEPFAGGAAGRVTVGLDYEDGAHRLWAAGGPTGEVRAYDTRTGEVLETYSFTAGFLNDVAVTDDAVYVTDSVMQQLLVIPLPDDGSVPDPADTFALPLTGDLEYVEGFNANGIVASDGWLILVQSNTGLLFRVDPATGATETIDLGSQSVSFGDGLELVGSTLYVVRNELGEVLEIRLANDLLSGTVIETLEPDGVDVPTTAAFVAGRLWLVNARFSTAPGPGTAYWLSGTRR